jgi:hypothetical protein
MEHALKVLRVAKFNSADEIARLKGTLAFHEGVQSAESVRAALGRQIAGQEDKHRDFCQALSILSEHTGELPVLSGKDETALVELLTGQIPIIK